MLQLILRLLKMCGKFQLEITETFKWDILPIIKIPHKRELLVHLINVNASKRYLTHRF